MRKLNKHKLLIANQLYCVLAFGGLFLLILCSFLPFSLLSFQRTLKCPTGISSCPLNFDHDYAPGLYLVANP